MDRFTEAPKEIASLYLPRYCNEFFEGHKNCEKKICVVNIKSYDHNGIPVDVYAGLCKVKLVDIYDENHNIVDKIPLELDLEPLSFADSIAIEELPLILDESNQASSLFDHNDVWVDPSTSPYVYNQCEPEIQTQNFVTESNHHITVNHHNTFITQNLYSPIDPNLSMYNQIHTSESLSVSKKSKQTAQPKTQPKTKRNCSKINYNEDDLESEMDLCELFEKTTDYDHTLVREGQKLINLTADNDALKQLMSRDIQSTTKPRKTILFLGQDSESGHTIQNISYSNAKEVQCVDVPVDEPVNIENAPSRLSKKKKYQCDNCKQIFNNITKFHQHMIKNHNNYAVEPDNHDGTWMCSVCGKTLKSQQQFEEHCLRHGDPDLECQTCHKVYASKFSLRTHRKIHERKFPCEHCIRTYATAEALAKHLKKVHRILRCEFDDCSYSTYNSSHLEDHHNNHFFGHIQNIENLEFDDDVFEGIECSEDAPLIDTDWKCDSGKIIDDEMVKKTKKANAVISKVMNNELFLMTADNAKKAARGRKKNCDICSKSFDRVSDLKRHLIEHAIRSTLAKSPSSKNGILNITCEVCKTASFNQIDQYKAHLREHAKMTIYKCMFCSKSFSDSSNFSKHKKVHGLSYFQCDLCNRKFQSKKMITQHIEYHNKNKPVKCGHCHKKFHFKSMLNKHIKCTHKKSTRSKFNCRFCNKTLSSLKSKWDHEWEEHNIRKSIIDCTICGYKFRKASELKKHYFDNHGVTIPRGRQDKLKGTKEHQNYYDDCI